MLDPTMARQRQKRLLKILQDNKLDAVVIGSTPHVYYLTAHLPFWQNLAAFVLLADGRCGLVTANKPDNGAAADVVESYVASFNSTQRQEQPELIAGWALKWLADKSCKRIGVDSSTVTSMVAVGAEATCQPIDADLWQLRRVKDSDELALLKVAIACTDAMYRRAREIIEPGIAELRVFNELHAAAVEVAGEPLSAHLGNDYACAEKGGPPRNHRVANAGELYILDLGPAYRGYFSDNCRTISVDRKPTDAQLRAWEVANGAFPIVEKMAKPGVSCRAIYEAVDSYYQSKLDIPFPHHLGHGIGLQPHEFPHMNPKWDDTLMEGEVFTIEPGVYAPELRAGLRLENDYLVTATGVTNLSPFPLQLI
jgi:Xaa-Pro dipeptidase